MWQPTWRSRMVESEWEHVPVLWFYIRCIMIVYEPLSKLRLAIHWFEDWPFCLWCLLSIRADLSGSLSRWSQSSAHKPPRHPKPCILYSIALARPDQGSKSRTRFSKIKGLLFGISSMWTVLLFGLHIEAPCTLGIPLKRCLRPSGFARLCIMFTIVLTVIITSIITWEFMKIYENHPC